MMSRTWKPRCNVYVAIAVACALGAIVADGLGAVFLGVAVATWTATAVLAYLGP